MMKNLKNIFLKIHLTTILMTKIMYSHFQLITIQFWQKKSIPLKNAIKESGLPDYAYQIVNGTRSNPGREKIICLCIAAHMNITETKRALEIAQAGILYPKNIRDAIIIKHINTDDFSVMNINCDLDKHGLPCLNDIK